MSQTEPKALLAQCGNLWHFRQLGTTPCQSWMMVQCSPVMGRAVLSLVEAACRLQSGVDLLSAAGSRGMIQH